MTPTAVPVSLTRPALPVKVGMSFPKLPAIVSFPVTCPIAQPAIYRPPALAAILATSLILIGPFAS